MNELGKLLCGSQNTSGLAKQALDQILRSITSFSNKAIGFLNDDASEDALNFGPFCARVVLENSCAALIGRLDSFRMLYLAEFQGQPEYEMGKRAKSSFSWFGDVIPEDKPNSPLWSLESDALRISRALFSRHFEHIYWRPAVEGLIDFASHHESRAALGDVLSLDPQKYINTTKGVSLQQYSILSKGVHWEFFSSAFVIDESTLKNSLRETLLLVAHLGLASHFVPTAYACLTAQDALDTYIKFREDVL